MAFGDAVTFNRKLEYQCRPAVQCRLAGSRRSLAVERQNFESLASVDTHRPKMPLIQAQDGVDAMALG
jgi:hypothetical protein